MEYFTKFHRTFNVNGQVEETFLFVNQEEGAFLRVLSNSLIATVVKSPKHIIANIDMNLIANNHPDAKYFAKNYDYDIPFYHVDMFENYLKAEEEFGLRYQARHLGKEMFFRMCQIYVEHFHVGLDMPIYLEPLPDTDENWESVRNANTLKLEAYYENELGFEKANPFQNVGSDGTYNMKSTFRKVLAKAKQMSFSKSMICASCYKNKAKYHDSLAQQIFCGIQCQTKYWNDDYFAIKK